MPRIRVGRLVAPSWLGMPGVRPIHAADAYLVELVSCALSVVGMTLAYGGRAYAELFWGDEIITADVIRQSAMDLIINRYSIGHSPLYFLIVRTWMLLTSGSEGL